MNIEKNDKLNIVLHMTSEQKFELLTNENKEIIKREIEILIASQSDHQSSSGFPE